MSIIINLTLFQCMRICLAYNQPMTRQNRDNIYSPPNGTPKNQLPTPALNIDLQALEYNLATMGGFFQSRKTKLRPHFKTHKCPEIAHRQMTYGAIGITCAKLGEADVLVNAGIPSVLIANQVIDPEKIKHLAGLARDCQLIVAVDQSDNLNRISKAAIEMGSTVHVVIEIDVGLGRAGVQPGVEALSLAKEASRLPGVHFSGVLGYEGFTMFEVDRDKRREKAHTAMEALVGTSELIQRAGIPVDVVSAGGTGTFDITGDFNGVTEVEAGSYVFMDTRYNQLGLPFKQALTLSAMVTSGRNPGRFIIDAGMKSLTTDNGMPEILTPGGLILQKLNEEHGIVGIREEGTQVQVGSRLEIIPSHVCTTVNLHDRYNVTREDKLVDIWEISGRGKSQ